MPLRGRRVNVCETHPPGGMPGVGKTSLEDKLDCTIRQLALEYGPESSMVRNVCWDTLSILTDMGTEFGIADSVDILDGDYSRHCCPQLSNQSNAVPDAPMSSTRLGGRERGFLFPSALRVPGPRHIIDCHSTNCASIFFLA